MNPQAYTGQRWRWRRYLAVMVLTALGLAGLRVGGSPTAIAADPPNQPFDLIYEANNVYYRGFQDGLGMLGENEGTLNSVTLDGTQIVKAYLVWAGLGRDDNGVTFARNAETPVAITPDYVWNNDTFGGSTWGCCGGELSVYAADITDENIVEIGTNSYTLGDMAITHIDNNVSVEENWGYSLLVIFEDPTLPQPRDIFIKLGNDGLFANWTGLIGPNSDVQCLAFDPSDASRMANFNVIVGGVENDKRPNALWGLSGNEDYVDLNNQGGTWTQSAGLIHLPPNIVGIDGVGGIQLDGPFAGDSTNGGTDLGPPFFDRNGDEWDEYQRFDVEIAPNEDWVCVQVESASQNNRPDLPPVVPDSPINENVPASIGFLGFIALIENVGDDPAIDIVKFTNGEDANDPDGADVPVVAPGDDVTWTYAVTNVGLIDIPEADITVTDSVEGDVTQIIDKGDGDAILSSNETWIYELQGTAIDTASPPKGVTLTLEDDVCTRNGDVSPPSTAYTNIGTVMIPTMKTSDPSSYCNPGSGPAIDIEKSTNGEDADTPTGPILEVGQTVTWTYVVTNTGNVTLTDVTVTDDVIGAVTCPQDTLAVDGSMTCTMNGTVTAGQYENMADVVGTSPGGQQVTDNDPSHYFGDGPAIDIIKYTNGEDANDPDGARVPLIAPGGMVTWTYKVTNIGTVDIPESDITVTDTVEGAVTQIVDKGDGDAILAPAETWLYQAVGIALDLANPPGDPGLALVPDVCTRGGAVAPSGTAYTNSGTISIPGMSASDPSSYCNPSRLTITKRTNGQDADDPNGDDVPFIAPGEPIIWTYEVTNNGGAGIAEADIIVTDNVIGEITEITDKVDDDAILAPGERWIYRAEGQAADLGNPDDPALVLVPDVCTRDGAPPGPAYTNIGTVTTPGASASDPSSYCNPPTLVLLLPLVSQQTLDWGDAPDSFNRTDEGQLLPPTHLLRADGPRLGREVDAERVNQPSDDANLDDLNPPQGPDDEDGLLSTIQQYGGHPLTPLVVELSNLDERVELVAWLDSNANGSFDTNERQAMTVEPSGESLQTVSLAFPEVYMPFAVNDAYLRLRVSTDPAVADSPLGSADDGEIEDHRLAVQATTLMVRVSDIGEPTGNLTQRRVTATLVTAYGAPLTHQFFGNIEIETPSECSQLPPGTVPPGRWQPLSLTGELSADYTSCLSESAALDAAAIETVDLVTDAGCRVSFPAAMKDIITVTVSPVESGARPNLACVLEVPTAITLAAFDAYAHDDGAVTITWTTAVEINNAGFNLYRAPAAAGPYTRINPQLIAGQGTGEGATYSFVDTPPQGGSLFYKLEDVDYNGSGTFHGPIVPVPAGE